MTKTTVKPPQMDEGCTHLEGYKLGFSDAYLQMVDRLNSIIEIKAEYDRAFCILRNEGVARADTTKLSTALSVMITDYKKTIILMEQDKNRASMKNATGQHVPVINPHMPTA